MQKRNLRNIHCITIKEATDYLGVRDYHTVTEILKEAKSYPDDHTILDPNSPTEHFGKGGRTLTINDLEILGHLLAGHRMHRNGLKCKKRLLKS